VLNASVAQLTTNGSRHVCHRQQLTILLTTDHLSPP